MSEGPPLGGCLRCWPGRASSAPSALDLGPGPQSVRWSRRAGPHHVELHPQRRARRRQEGARPRLPPHVTPTTQVCVSCPSCCGVHFRVTAISLQRASDA